MILTNQEAIFASLLGSKIIDQVPRFAKVENKLAKHVLPTFPYPYLKNKIEIREEKDTISEFENWSNSTSIPVEQQFFPLSLSVDEGQNYFTMPYEPLINLSGKNIVTRRTVAKSTNGFGTIKERWARDDFEITITGVLMSSVLTGNAGQCYPREDFEKLMFLLTASKSIQVQCELLQLSGISNIVIEDYSFPFSKGENVQAYEIKAYSDTSVNLLLTAND